MTALTTVRGTALRWLPLGLVFLTVGLSTAMAAPFLTLFLNEGVHAGPVRIAVFLAAAPISAVIVSTLVGRLSDRLPSRRLVLIGTTLAGCAATAATAFVRDYTTLLAVGVTLTALAGAVMPQTFAYAREAVGDSDKVAMTMSTLRTVFSIAWVAGPPLAALLLDAGGFTLVYGSASVMYAAAALVVLLALPAFPAAAAGEASPQREAGADAPRALIWVTVVAFVLTRCCGSLAVQGLSLFVTRDLGGGVGEAGLLLGLCAALEIPLMLGFGWLATRVPVRRLLIVGTGCALGYLLIVALAHSTWELMAGQVLNAASIASLTGLGVTYIQDLLPAHPGRASTLYSNTFLVGTLLAAPILGAAQTVGFRLPYVVGTVLCAISLVLLAVTSRRGAGGSSRRRSPTAAPSRPR